MGIKRVIRYFCDEPGCEESCDVVEGDTNELCKGVVRIGDDDAIIPVGQEPAGWQVLTSPRFRVYCPRHRR